MEKEPEILVSNQNCGNNSIIFLGSPMMDVTARVDAAFLEKYNLQPDNAYVIDETNEAIFEDVPTSATTVGGSVTNTARIFNKKCPRNHNCHYLGAIGQDAYGKTIRTLLEEEGIVPGLVEIEDKPTGKVAVLLCGPSRSLVTDLGASKYFLPSHVDWDLVARCSYFYVSAFFIGVSFEVIEKIIDHFSKEAGKTVAVNLGASFLCRKRKNQVGHLYKMADLVFGNESEHRAFAEVHDVAAPDLGQTVLKCCQLFVGDKPKISVVTRGDRPVMVVAGDRVEEFEVARREDVADTNGAGDAFVGGFLASYVGGGGVADSVRSGIEAAAVVIRNVGCDVAIC